MTETSTALTVVPQNGLSIMVTPDEARENLIKLQTFIKEYFTPEDYGLIPGTGDKPALKKPGAEKLLELYGFYPDYEMTQRVEDWDKLLFDYEFKCTIRRRSDDKIMGVGVGSCNSYESRYRWRKAARSCPECGAQTIKVSQYEPVGSFYCYGKTGGCGAKFPKDASVILDQPQGRVLNEDLADQKNTTLKQGKKRALVDAAMSATRSSGLFTQDIDEMAQFDYATGEIVEAEIVPTEGKPGLKSSSSSSQTTSRQSQAQSQTSSKASEEKKSTATTAQASGSQSKAGANGANQQGSNQQTQNTGASVEAEAKKPSAGTAGQSANQSTTGAANANQGTSKPANSSATGATQNGASSSGQGFSVQPATNATSESTNLVTDEQRKNLLDTAKASKGWAPPQVAQYLKTIGTTLSKLTVAQMQEALTYTTNNSPR